MTTTTVQTLLSGSNDRAMRQ